MIMKKSGLQQIFVCEIRWSDVLALAVPRPPHLPLGESVKLLSHCEGRGFDMSNDTLQILPCREGPWQIGKLM
jgi:hypothetical protein